jgi:drug/metabolite transporter (DMT)-like permease
MQQVNNPELPALTAELASAPKATQSRVLSTVLVIGAALMLNVVGQTLLKYGMGAMGPLQISAANLPHIVWQMIFSPYVIGGMLVYAVATFFWLVTLSRVDLSVAYPSLSLTQVLVLGVAWLILREEISPMRVAGVLVICLGMLLVARS